MFDRWKAVLPAICAITLAAAGCGSSGVNNQADTGPSNQQSQSDEAPPATAPETTEAEEPSGPAKIGDAITISGFNDGEQVKVTVLKIQNTTPKNEYITPEEGNRLVAVQFRIENIGTAAYDDSPSNGARVIDADSQQFDADVVFSDSAPGPDLPSAMKIRPGGKAVGYLVFQVPRASKIAGVQFGMNSGMGETAEWVR